VTSIRVLILALGAIGVVVFLLTLPFVLAERRKRRA